MTLSNEEFTKEFIKLGAQQLADKLGQNVRTVYRRRARIEVKENLSIARGTQQVLDEVKHSPRIDIELKDGVVLVGSDAHYWPGEPSTAHRAFVKFAAEFVPEVIVVNGDALDAACISRHPPIGWEDMPTVREELDVVQARLDEIAAASPFSDLIWSLGNHDARFETKLASVAPEFKNVHGVHLKDHFPLWSPCWAVHIGGQHGVVIKHRYKGGLHAPHNNVVSSGRSMVTGHLHSQKVTPYTDYNGTRWGVDSGTLAALNGPQFVDYTEDNPLNWRSGFCLLTFKNGELLPPELITVWDENSVTFRGEIITV